MSIRPINYKKSVIYKIFCKDPKIKEFYIGSTTNFMKRQYAHYHVVKNKNSKIYNQPLYKFIRDNGGWQRWDMAVIEKYECNNRFELNKRERYHIEHMNPALNTYYHIKNKDDVRKRNKEYYQNNKERHNIYYKKYREKNKDKLREYHKEYQKKNIRKKCTCVCGSIYDLSHRKRHEETIKHKTYINNMINVQ